MIIVYKTNHLEALCTDERIAVRKLGARCAKQLWIRVDQLVRSPTLETMRLVGGDCHELKGNLAGCLAVRIHRGVRLVFQPHHDPVPVKSDGGLDWGAVTCVCVTSVEDYHD